MCTTDQNFISTFDTPTSKNFFLQKLATMSDTLKLGVSEEDGGVEETKTTEPEKMEEDSNKENVPPAQPLGPGGIELIVPRLIKEEEETKVTEESKPKSKSKTKRTLSEKQKEALKKGREKLKEKKSQRKETEKEVETYLASVLEELSKKKGEEEPKDTPPPFKKRRYAPTSPYSSESDSKSDTEDHYSSAAEDKDEEEETQEADYNYLPPYTPKLQRTQRVDFPRHLHGILPPPPVLPPQPTATFV